MLCFFHGFRLSIGNHEAIIRYLTMADCSGAISSRYPSNPKPRAEGGIQACHPRRAICVLILLDSIFGLEVVHTGYLVVVVLA